MEAKTKMSELKQDVNNLTNEVSNMKKSLDKPGKDKSADKERECNYCGKMGHTEAFCHKKIGDDAVKASKKSEQGSQ